LPSVGRISTFAVPEGPGVRNDAGVARGCEVTPYYDPMLAKLIVHDDSRELCIARLAAALEEYRIGGVETNLAFLRWIVGHPAFLRGDTTTAFIEQHFSPEALHREEDTELAKLAAAAAAQSLNHEGCVGFKERRASARREPQSGEFERRASARRLADVWHRLGGWRHSAAERTVYFADGTCASVAQTAGGAWRVVAAKECIVETNEDGGVLRIAGRSHPFLAWPAKGGIAVNFNGAVLNVPLMPPPSVALSAKSHHGAHGTADSVEAPMSGKIVKVLVSVGDRVEPRQTVVVMEAMKMEHSIAAPYGGSVAAVNAREAATVSAGDVLVEIEAQS
jgi:acetyl/propionyl-CoA carboxylase alpha subunit